MASTLDERLMRRKQYSSASHGRAFNERTCANYTNACTETAIQIPLPLKWGLGPFVSKSLSCVLAVPSMKTSNDAMPMKC
eukprot:4525750-Amphidinium_carterae.1